MELQWWTPHQYQNIRPYVDTVLLGAWQLEPFDVAIPYGASRIICQQIVHRLTERYQGRIASLELGATFRLTSAPETPDVPQWLENALHDSIDPGIRFGIVMVDRQLPRSFQRLSSDSMEWLVCDWWQWLSRRIPAARHQDAWMYLSMTSMDYRSRPEFHSLGVSSATAESMHREGERIMEVWVRVAAAAVERMWQETAHAHAQRQAPIGADQSQLDT
ncbi:hypothetical protein [Alicyclobacillus shizuokensis]|uniref:hypothetical protein n=1 Tax=Alicyclobacillus shizuokensis TaxID=392014 RepID=UPI000831B122|nr:hypothetical protein [Alicyclobacillus shizuokensis]MCL6625967.1 hypothetical protein [Alicyclobacillus shizuokensis]